MEARWLTTLARDPFYNPNLSERFDFSTRPLQIEDGTVTFIEVPTSGSSAEKEALRGDSQQV